MNILSVKIDKREVEIDEQSFVDLLDFPPTKEMAAYENALSIGSISIKDLKHLAEKSDVPYPLFFAPRKIVLEQIKTKNKLLHDKIPGKSEMSLASRGTLKVQDVELIVRDLGRKQEFLKRRVSPDALDNLFIGSVAKKVKQNIGVVEIASDIRALLGINLSQMRKGPKGKVLEYLCEHAESRNILVSFSSHNYMPQVLDKELSFSGLCVKDKKYPYIFINRRDGDEDPKILETEGRQILTLVCMLVCVAMNKFIFNIKSQGEKNSPFKKVFSIAGEILIPKTEIGNINITNLDDVQRHAGEFKVTPSMFLMRLLELNLISKPLAAALFGMLKEELKNRKPTKPRSPLPVTAYGRYNGVKMSHDVVRAQATNKIAMGDLKNILFRRGRVDMQLVGDYCTKFR